MPRAGWLALGAVIGAQVAEAVPEAHLALPTVLCMLAAAAAIVLRRAPMAAIAVASALVLGRVLIGGTLAPPEVELDRVAAGVVVEHNARVQSLGVSAGGQQRAVLELLPPESAARVYAWLPRYPALIPGDAITFRGALEAAPAGDGFGEYLARSGIEFTSRPRGMSRLDLFDTAPPSLEPFRRAGGEALARTLPQPQAGLAAAILIGLRDLVAREVSDAFRVSGLSHVVAISGFHVALLGGVVNASLRRLPRRWRSILVVAVIAAYAVIAGASPSVLRAAIMAAVVVLARESGRRGTASAALGLTAVGMLIADPEIISDVGFQLSLTATAGLLAWAAPISGVVGSRLPSRTPRWLVESIAVSLAAQAATLPLVLLHFGRLSLVAPLANLLVAPIVAPVMLASALALAAGILLGGLGAAFLAPFSVLGSIALGSMIAVAQVTASLPFASVELPPPLDLATAVLAAISLLAAALVGRRRTHQGAGRAPPSFESRRTGGQDAPRSRARGRVSRAVLAGACVLAMMLVLVGAARPDGRLRVTVLDVGQGDAILLQGPAGGRILVDTGPDPDRLLSLLDGRIPAWDRRLDLVVITHPHEDHVAGLGLLLDRYRIGAVAEPGMIGPGPGDAAFRQRMAALGKSTRVIAAGDRLAFDGVAINVHWPPPGTVPVRPADSGKAINNVSLVLEIAYGERRFLLTGDVEEEIDPQLLATDIGDGSPIDVLKVAHHGSGTATTDAFVERLQPRVAVVSAGWGNPYGHPSPRTVARLQAAGARLYRTDLDGSVELSTDGVDLVALAVGGRPRPQAVLPAAPAGVGFCPVPVGSGARRRPYNRRHGRPHPHRSGADPARSRSPRVVHGAFGDRGRGGGLPCRAHRRSRHGGRSGARRGGGTAA